VDDGVGTGTLVTMPVVEVDVPGIQLVVGTIAPVVYLLLTKVVAGTMDVVTLGTTSTISSVTLSHRPATAVRLLSPVES
jgi:hypothetical protein